MHLNNQYKYHITFHDTMETGLTFKEITSVKVNGITTTNYTLTRSPNDGHSFDLTLSWGNGTDKITNTALNEAEVIVEFTATLNEKAVLGKPGNVNTAYLEYSCNPNLTDDGNGRMKPSEETNNTPKDSVIAFTYKIVISKVDEHHKPLAGAMFKLEKEIKGDDPQIISTVEANPNEVFTFNGLDDGNYILTEIKVPDGYKPIDPFTIRECKKQVNRTNGCFSPQGVERRGKPRRKEATYPDCETSGQRTGLFHGNADRGQQLDTDEEGPSQG